MMNWGRFLPLFLLPGLLSSYGLMGQSLGIDPNREIQLQASTKQINQFFRRFNAEEAPDGQRWYEGHVDFRSPYFRRKYIPLLIDKQAGIPDSLTSAFVAESVENNQYLSLHAGNFLAEVQVVFAWEGRLDTVQLMLSVQEEEIGSKWVIVGVQGISQLTVGYKDTGQVFLHPMSHEIEFMNLFRAFQDAENLHSYVKEDFSPDGLSVLWYEIQRKRVVFKSVLGVRFHCRQIPGWYFVLQQKLRPELNSGWLITKLERTRIPHPQSIRNE